MWCPLPNPICFTLFRTPSWCSVIVEDQMVVPEQAPLKSSLSRLGWSSHSGTSLQLSSGGLPLLTSQTPCGHSRSHGTPHWCQPRCPGQRNQAGPLITPWFLTAGTLGSYTLLVEEVSHHYLVVGLLSLWLPIMTPTIIDLLELSNAELLRVPFSHHVICFSWKSDKLRNGRDIESILGSIRSHVTCVRVAYMGI
jgi:hypothetical protein